jgi:D-alanyl-D-alanine carboxypeptidase (penicillin-binding protein 5/6)
MFRVLLASLLSCSVLLVCIAPAAQGATSPAVPACAAVEGARVGEGLASTVPVRTSPVLPPPLTAQAAVVVDGDTGRVLLDLGAHQRRPPASTTKIMTAILAIERGGLDETVVSDVDATHMTGSSVMGLRPGVAITVRDLLYGLMLPSGNDAAVQLAEHDGGSVGAFVDGMNAKARELGLLDTHYVNPHGLSDSQHYSSAYDLARLARFAMRNPQFAEIVIARRWHLSPPSDYDLTNGNTLLGAYPGADGVKIGWTEDAGWTLVASAVRNGHRLFVTVLNSRDRDADAAALLDWAFGTYDWVQLGPRFSGQLRVAERLGMGSSLLRALSVCA